MISDKILELCKQVHGREVDAHNLHNEDARCKWNAVIALLESAYEYSKDAEYFELEELEQ